jgi:hypothetical protein
MYTQTNALAMTGATALPLGMNGMWTAVAVVTMLCMVLALARLRPRPTR